MPGASWRRRSSGCTGTARRSKRRRPPSRWPLTRNGRIALPASPWKVWATTCRRRARPRRPPGSPRTRGRRTCDWRTRPAGPGAWTKPARDRTGLSSWPPTRRTSTSPPARSRRRPANPAGLARAAEGFATAVRSDPRAAVSRHNLDLVVREFLTRATYGIWLGTYLVARLGRLISPAVGRIVALVLLAILSLFVWGFVGRLTTDLRRYLVRVLLGRRLRLAAGLDVLAAGCLIAGLAAPSPLRPGLTIAAPVAALIARLLLW